MRLVAFIILLLFFSCQQKQQKVKEIPSTQKAEKTTIKITPNLLYGEWYVDSVANSTVSLKDIMVFTYDGHFNRIEFIDSTFIIERLVVDEDKLMTDNIRYNLTLLDSSLLLIESENEKLYCKPLEFDSVTKIQRRIAIPERNLIVGKWRLDSATTYPIEFSTGCTDLYPNSIIEFTSDGILKTLFASDKSEIKCKEMNYGISFDFGKLEYTFHTLNGCVGNTIQLKSINNSVMYLAGNLRYDVVLKLVRVK